MRKITVQYATSRRLCTIQLTKNELHAFIEWCSINGYKFEFLERDANYHQL